MMLTYADPDTGQTWPIDVTVQRDTYLYGEDADGRRGERRTEVDVLDIEAPTGCPDEAFNWARRKVGSS